LTVWKEKFWQFEKGNFDSLVMENFDSLEREILTVWKGKFWQFRKENFDGLEKENFDSLERKILTIWNLHNLRKIPPIKPNLNSTEMSNIKNGNSNDSQINDFEYDPSDTKHNKITINVWICLHCFYYDMLFVLYQHGKLHISLIVEKCINHMENWENLFLFLDGNETINFPIKKIFTIRKKVPKSFVTYFPCFMLYELWFMLMWLYF
jgi:hypothetical protein